MPKEKKIKKIKNKEIEQNIKSSCTRKTKYESATELNMLSVANLIWRLVLGIMITDRS